MESVSLTGCEMPDAVLKLMRVLFHRIAAHEAQAAQDPRRAPDVGEEGQYGEAEVLRLIARGHWIVSWNLGRRSRFLRPCSGRKGRDQVAAPPAEPEPVDTRSTVSARGALK
jgi:hypothetical protein